ncbi:MAG TPA: small ribosomal subunit Rsm22 family protein [Nitrospira sp.]
MRRHNVTVSSLLLQGIHQIVEKEGLSGERLAQAVGQLSRLFTKERAGLKKLYLEDDVCAAAYLHYFLPVNFSKIQVLLDEMPPVETSERISVLDLGCGPGTGALAVLDWWQQCRPSSALSVVAMDTAPNALRQAEQLWNVYCRESRVTRASLQTYESDVERNAWLEQLQKKAPFNIIILANCLNEIHVDAQDPIAARSHLVTKLLALLASHGTMMIIEPALKGTSRALHQVRDMLMQEKHCNIYSPCLHENRCPALVNPDDWCHEERAWEAPAVIQQIDEEVGFIKDALKFSYLLLRTDGRTIVARQSNVYRVVSELRILKGDTRAWLCNELGRSEVGRLDRAQSESNAEWDECQRGTIVKIEGMTKKEGSTLERIPSGASLEIIRSV